MRENTDQNNPGYGHFLRSNEDLYYLKLLSRGDELTITSTDFIDYVCNGFVVLERCFRLIEESKLTARVAADHLLDSALKMEYFTCTNHENSGYFITNRKILNIFFNNKSIFSTDCS